MSEPETVTPLTVEDALRARVAELEQDLAAERQARRESQQTNNHLLHALLDLRAMTRKEPQP